MIHKSDLLLGDIVVLRNGMSYVVCNTRIGIRLLANNGFQYIEDYNEELMYIRNIGCEKPLWDIVIVYRLIKESLKITYSYSVYYLRSNKCSYYDFAYSISKSEVVLNSNNFINISLYV